MRTYEIRTCRVRDLAPAVRDGELLPVGESDGEAWTDATRAGPFASLERRWPIGTLVAWAPRPGTLYLLDGHRRVGCIAGMLGGDRPLARDLSADEPAYVPTDTAEGGPFLPVTAMLETLPFLAATWDLPPPMVDRAGAVAMAMMGATVELLTLRVAESARAAEMCGHLLPGRVDGELLEQLVAGDYAHGSRP